MLETKARLIHKLEEINNTEICYWKEKGSWWIYFPGCGVGNLLLHKITEHEDGTISASPSIKVTGHTGKEVHGFLERGIWRDV